MEIKAIRRMRRSEAQAVLWDASKLVTNAEHVGETDVDSFAVYSRAADRIIRLGLIVEDTDYDKHRLGQITCPTCDNVLTTVELLDGVVKDRSDTFPNTVVIHCKHHFKEN